MLKKLINKFWPKVTEQNHVEHPSYSSDKPRKLDDKTIAKAKEINNRYLPIIENTKYYENKRKKFLGKTENFKDKSERRFEQAHLKAYLAGHRQFPYGSIDGKPFIHPVKIGWV